MAKHPRVRVSIPAATKLPRGRSLADVSDKKFNWRVSDIDFEGPFGWDGADIRQLMSDIVPKLHNYETMTWSEVDGPSGSHSVEFGQLCKEARDRLAEIGKEHQEYLFSLRITGECRVWGVKDLAILRILWWDPNHAVCPSPKKHT
jgi:hypothetical protein